MSRSFPLKLIAWFMLGGSGLSLASCGNSKAPSAQDSLGAAGASTTGSGGTGNSPPAPTQPPVLLTALLKPAAEGQLTCRPVAPARSIPATGKVLFVAMTGDDTTGDGSDPKPFATIQKAADLAMPGDTVVVREGTYRGRVAPPRGGVEGMPITYLAEPGKQVTLKGSQVWKPAWEASQPGLNIFKAIPDPALFKDTSQIDGPNPLLVMMSGKPGLTLGQIFVDGERMVAMPAAADIRQRPGSWHYDAATQSIQVHFPLGKLPETSVVELTTERRVFAPHLRGLGYITLSGFTIEHCANNYPGGFYNRNSVAEQQAGMVGTRSGHHWVIENNIIRQAQSLGIDCGSESEVSGEYDIEGVDQTRIRATDGHVIANNFIADNGTNGMMCFGGTGISVLNNVFARNNHLDPPGGAEPAAIKVHLTTGFTVIGNLFLDNNTLGMYFDNNNRESRVSRNVFIGNDRAVFLELGRADYPALVDNNIFVDNIANGVYMHDSSGARIVHNLIATTQGNDEWGSAAEGYFLRRVTERVATTSSNFLLANILIGNEGGSLSIPYPCGGSLNNRTDFNVYADSVLRPLAVNLHCPMNALMQPATPFMSRENLIQQVATELTALGFPAPVNPRTTSLGVGLTLEEWRAFWSSHNEPHDQKSVISKATAELNRATWTLKLNLDIDLASVGSEATPGTDMDFAGQPLPLAGLAKPGPLQSLVPGMTEIRLFKCAP